MRNKKIVEKSFLLLVEKKIREILPRKEPLVVFVDLLTWRLYNKQDQTGKIIHIVVNASCNV